MSMKSRRIEGIAITDCFRRYRVEDVIVGKDESGSSCVYFCERMPDETDRYHMLGSGAMWYVVGDAVKGSPYGPFLAEELPEIVKRLGQVDKDAAGMYRENFFDGLFNFGETSIGILPAITPSKDSRYESY